MNYKENYHRKPDSALRKTPTARDSVNAPVRPNFSEADKRKLLNYASLLEGKAAAIRAACNGEPVQFTDDRGAWFDPKIESFDILINPYAIFRPNDQDEKSPR